MVVGTSTATPQDGAIRLDSTGEVEHWTVRKHVVLINTSNLLFHCSMDSLCLERRPFCLLGCQPSWLLTRSFVPSCHEDLADQLEDALLSLSMTGLKIAIYPCGCLSGSGLLALSPEAYHVIVELLTRSTSTSFLSATTVSLRSLMRLRLLGLSDCVHPSSLMAGLTIWNSLVCSCPLGFGALCWFGGRHQSHDGDKTPPWVQPPTWSERGQSLVSSAGVPSVLSPVAPINLFVCWKAIVRGM